MKNSLNNLYSVLSVSKQAVHQSYQRHRSFEIKMEELILQADVLRGSHPGCGLEKMYHILQPTFLGRDRFIAAMQALSYGLKRTRNYHKTTIAGSKHYPNLIERLLVDSPCTVWQSDITYYKLDSKHYYAVFIIDVYSKIIVGGQASDHMRTEANMKALNMALNQYPAPKIHHSDRGAQYSSNAYVKKLKDSKSKISMAPSGLDNAYAERINRTIKEEYLDHWNIANLTQLRKALKKAVVNYNSIRIHNGLKYKMSPIDFYKYWQILPNNLRPKIKIYKHEK